MTHPRDMSPEKMRAHLEHINSPEFGEAILAQFKREEQERRSVTTEEAAKRHMQEIILSENGVPRFRENVLVSGMLATPGKQRGDPKEAWMHAQLRHLLDKKKGNAIVRWLAKGENLCIADMNEIAVEDFTQKDREEFAMLIGYSVGGAADLPYFSDAMWERANAEAERLLEAGRKG